jgi:hypothetical protein
MSSCVEIFSERFIRYTRPTFCHKTFFLSKEEKRYESNRIRENLISFCKLELQEETEFVCFLETIYYSKMKQFPTRIFLKKKIPF